MSKLFTSLLLADAVVRGEIDLNARGGRRESGRDSVAVARWTFDQVAGSEHASDGAAAAPQQYGA